MISVLKYDQFLLFINGDNKSNIISKFNIIMQSLSTSEVRKVIYKFPTLGLNNILYYHVFFVNVKL